MNLGTNSLQEGGYDRRLSLDPIEEELEEEPLQFKETTIRSRNKHLEEQISSRILMLHEDWNSKDTTKDKGVEKRKMGEKSIKRSIKRKGRIWKEREKGERKERKGRIRK